VAAVALAVAAAVLAQSKPIVVHGATFAYRPHGWRVFDRDFAYLTRRGADVESVALSWPYRPNQFGWATRMPPNGVAVTVHLIRRSADPRANLCGGVPHWPGAPRIRRLPLRLPSTTSDRLEGAPGVLEYRVSGRMDESYNVDLRVDVNRLRPTRVMLRRAQAIVSAIRFPRWPRPKRC
jgi:hypothetical protein